MLDQRLSRLETLLLACALLVVGPALARAQEPSSEAEPNDAAAQASPLELDRPFRGALADRDVDLAWFELSEPTRVDLRWRPLDQERLTAELWLEPDWTPRVQLRGAPVEVLGHTLPAGRHTLRLSARAGAGAYELVVSRAPAGSGDEVEPNDTPARADRLMPGQTRRGWVSHPQRDRDLFAVSCASEGIQALSVRVRSRGEGGARRAPCELVLRVLSGGRAVYEYRLDEVDREFRFYPRLAAGEHQLELTVARAEVGDEYELELTEFEPQVTDELTAAARAAIDRGLGWLIEQAEAGDDPARAEVAALSCALAALAEGSGAADRAEERRAAVQRLLARLQGLRTEVPAVQWRGAPLHRYPGTLYEQSLAALALAECVAAGVEEARAPCEQAARFLLAAQLGPERPWAPCEADSPQRGGWRYRPTDTLGDISVSGWCLVALFATHVAGVEVPGLVPAVEQGLEFVARCRDPEVGFTYTTRGERTLTSIRQGIGALLYLLLDRQGGELELALRHLDQHLCAGTQTGVGNEAPFYYWYYATRVHFLRGGPQWRAWRAVTLRQLVRRQTGDGSWAALREEVPGGRRLSTGLAIMVLRLCLGEAPAYLSRELEAF